MSEALILVVYAMGLIWLLAAYSYPHHAVWFLLLWVPIQGWVQLNLFNDSSATVLLYEFQVIGIYLVFAARALNEPARFGPPRAMWLAVPFAIWALLLTPWSFVTNGATLTAFGIRTLLLPLPLVWIGYRTFENVHQLKHIGKLLMVEMLIVAWVAASQFAGFIDPLRGDTITPAGFVNVGIIRPPGTFSSPGHLGMYVLFGILLAVGLLGTSVAKRTRAIYAVGLVSATVALIVNTQRATTVLLFVTLPIVFLLCKKVRFARTASIALLVLVVGGGVGSQIAGGAFLSRVTSIVDDARRSLQTIPLARMADALETPLVGRGLGIASPGTQRINVGLGRSGGSARQELKPAESFMASLVYNLGVPGLCLFYLFVLALVRAGIRSVRQCRLSDLELLASALVGFQIAILIQSWTYDPLNYPPSRVLFWVWSGVLLSLPRLTAAASHREHVPLPRQVTSHGHVVRSPVTPAAAPGSMAARPMRRPNVPLPNPPGLPR